MPERGGDAIDHAMNQMYAKHLPASVPSKEVRQADFRARMMSSRAAPAEVVKAASLFQSVSSREMKVRYWPSL